MASAEWMTGSRLWLLCWPALAAGVLIIGVGACRGAMNDGPAAGHLTIEAPASATPEVLPTEEQSSQSPFPVPTHSRTPTLAATATFTPRPTSVAKATRAEQTDRPSPTSAPATARPETRAPSPTPILVTSARVIYHDGFDEGGVGVYAPGASPWLDLLVQLGGTWYGPEREPDDEVEARSLPEGYRWEATGGFGTLPNGEAWWAGSATVGTARLLGPEGHIVVEMPLQVAFRDGRDGGQDPGPEPTPT